MRTTLADVKASQIPKALGMAGCNAEFLNIVNEAIQRLVMGPDLYWEVYQRYRFIATNGLVTWPRQVASVIKLAFDSQPYRLHNEWFEFLDSGYGVRVKEDCDNRGVDRGTSCLISDIDVSAGTNPKTLKFYSSVTETAADKIIVRGYDDSGDWVRTQVGGSWVDGEHIQVPPLSTTPRTSIYNWSAVTDIIKPITNGEILLYERNTVTGDQRKIGHYETDETRPSYRRTLVLGAGEASADDTAEETCHRTVTAVIKREFMQVRNDNDHLLIGNIPALKEMCMAVRRRETGRIAEAEVYEAKARQLLDREISHYIGPSNNVPLNVVADNFGMADVAHVQ